MIKEEKEEQDKGMIEIIINRWGGTREEAEDWVRCNPLIGRGVNANR